MGLHIKKSIKIGNLLKINKERLTASLPDTGISYDTNLGGKKVGKK